jgi:hypothetical protein
MPFEPLHALHSRFLFLVEADIDHFLEDKLSWEVFLEQSPLLVLYGSLDLRSMGPVKSGYLLPRLHLEKLNKDFLLALYLVVVVLYSLRFQEFCHQIPSTQIVDVGFQAPPQNQMFQLDLLNSLV